MPSAKTFPQIPYDRHFLNFYAELATIPVDPATNLCGSRLLSYLLHPEHLDLPRTN